MTLQGQSVLRGSFPRTKGIARLRHGKRIIASCRTQSGLKQSESSKRRFGLATDKSIDSGQYDAVAPSHHSSQFVVVLCF
jgi:hypothetical protein